MNTKLTLNLNENIIANAKVHAIVPDLLEQREGFYKKAQELFTTKL